MKKILLPLLAVLVMGLPGQTLDEVLARNYRARGGLDKLQALKAWKMSGKISLPEQKLELPIEIWQKAPDKLRVETAFQGMKITQGYDGSSAWWIMPLLAAEAREMPADQARQFREQAVLENPLVDFKAKGYALELLGQEDLEGKPVFKLKMVKDGGREIYFYLDAESGIERKVSRTVKEGSGDALVEILYGGYKAVDGLLLPHALENRVNGKTRMKLAMDSIAVNPVLSDAIFASPEKKEDSADRTQSKK
jgi:zinc protease